VGLGNLTTLGGALGAAAEVVERAVGSYEASAASSLWAAVGVKDDGGGVSVDNPSSPGEGRRS
jgi:hypothetical protein